MSHFAAEIIGTAILILLGGGVVANVALAETKSFDAGWLTVCTGWGLGVALAVYAVGSISGAHLNPAVSIGLATAGLFEWKEVPTYIAGQMIGALIGSTLVFLAFYGHWGATRGEGSEATKLSVFATTPAIRGVVPNLLTEVIGTFVLVYGVMAIATNFGDPVGPKTLQDAFGVSFVPLVVGLLVLAIGISLGGPTGYAINPARDLGPRIAHFLLPIPGKGGSDWGYAWIPVVGPIAGALLAAGLYKITLG